MTPDEIPADILAAASIAAFPGLPEGIPLEQAERRVRNALLAAWPLIEKRVRQQAADEILNPVRMLEPTL